MAIYFYLLTIIFHVSYTVYFINKKLKQLYHVGSTLHDPATLTFDLRVNECRGPAIEYSVPSLVLMSQVIFLSECHQQRWR